MLIHVPMYADPITPTSSIHTHQVIQQRKASGGKGAMYSPSPAKPANGNGKKKAAPAAAASSKKGKGGGGKKIRLDEDVPVDTGLPEAGDEGVGTLGFS